MRTHTIIESLSAYKAVRERDPEGKRLWWTTSPFLLVRIAELGEDIRSPEEGLDNATFNALAVASGEFARNCCSSVQAQIASGNQVDLSELLEGQIGRLFFTTFYLIFGFIHTSSPA